MDYPKSVPGVSLLNGQFTDGNPLLGIPASLDPAKWANDVTEELLNVIRSAGLEPSEGNSAQLLDAINAIVMDSAAPAATTEKAGMVELATPQEGIAGTDQSRAIVPIVLAAVLASYAKLASPAFTGAPTAPTAAPGTNSTQLANTAFVQAAIAALVDSSPAALNTLNELAAALGDDPNFAASVTNALAGKQAASVNLTSLSGLAGAADKLGYFIGAGAMALTTFTAFARQVIAAADAPTARAVLGAISAADVPGISAAQELSAIGSYITGVVISGSYGPGTTVAGSNIRYSGSGGGSGTSPTGTWMCVGNGNGTTGFKRIA